MRALAEPLEFPPLAAGIVPGDRVAIAVDEPMPCVAEIVRGAVESLKKRASRRETISVVTTDCDNRSSLSRRAGEHGSWCRSSSFTIRTMKSICAWSA